MILSKSLLAQLLGGGHIDTNRHMNTQTHIPTCRPKLLELSWAIFHIYGREYCLSVFWNQKLCEIRLFATVRHGCKGNHILHNHDSWLRRIFSPLQPWLTVAKRLISRDFPIIFIKLVDFWIWPKRANLIFHSLK